MIQGEPLVNSEYLLQKFPGKGGWTYAAIPEVLQNKHNPFGWVKVNGTIDDFELNKYKLMPMGNGSLFLPVKAEIRKIIKKQAGDYVRVLLYADESPLKVPDEIIECFKNEPKEVYENFQNLTEGEQKTYLDWINSAKTDETKADRIIRMMDRLQKNLKFAVKNEKG
jgi:hypothetical protein